MDIILIIVTAVIGYLIGSIPVGLVIGTLKGIDVRQHGSGRTGATNVMRAAGKGAAAVTFIADVLKGVVSVIIARLIAPELPIAWVTAGLGAIAGHNWSLYIGLRGGAGTTPNLGAMLALSPWSILITVPIGALILARTRYASVGSLTVSIVAPFALVATIVLNLVPREDLAAFLVYGLVQLIFVAASLKDNIQRLRAGTERQVSLGQQSKPV
ncbi:MAG: glycerol-3-phosphate acyltransferase [Chloroflexi bacterium]|nr:glycerol-3-phosphate acyltransferase [Chloroflexota bacterium]